MTETSLIPIGISSCLLGNEVRYDGSHRWNKLITDSLGRYFQFVPFCPEVAIGMGVPRPPIQLVQFGEEVRAQGVRDKSMDVTEKLRAYGKESVRHMENLRGYLFKKGSPSCGVERVKLYHQNGNPVSNSAGLFAQEIMLAKPEMPVEEEGRLMDPVLRENFIERVFIYDRWLLMVEAGITPQSLVQFHTVHKFNLLAHDELVYRELGRLVSDAGKGDIEERAASYIQSVMQALKKPATTKTHTNVLMHIMGFIKEHLDAQDKQELLVVLDDYRLGTVPLIVPVTLLKHYLRRYPNEYIERQYYLNPHPKELMLRNSI